ncbi:hypothetical protein OS242_17450 [Tumebacillus sp. DT12]|uniref:Uncharacterized protein n=1 Tax=Tumebacillus lacus TaxID=2995335 RepID=A0ABT3X790_9BACL|nr:hypothetical protein [Tumebacillus lacus]MCX7571732.1 hypothetical protein [Tumebacillus lacus]
MIFDIGFWNQIAAAWTQGDDEELQAHIEDTAEQVVHSVLAVLNEHETVRRIPSALEAIFGENENDDDFF